MITEFILISFASTIGWELIRYFSFAEIPARIAPVIIVVISYLFTLAMAPSVLVAFAATGGVAVIHRIINAEGLEPLKLEFLGALMGRLLSCMPRKEKKFSRIPPLP